MEERLSGVYAANQKFFFFFFGLPRPDNDEYYRAKCGRQSGMPRTIISRYNFNYVMIYERINTELASSMRIGVVQQVRCLAYDDDDLTAVDEFTAPEKMSRHFSLVYSP